MTVRLQQQSYAINPKRVRRLMRTMGLQAVYPGPRTSIPALQHKKYPYLLGGLEVRQPNQVWSADITYVPMPVGFIYLVAIIDWFSRFVLAWQLSTTLDDRFCLDALRLALQVSQPDIFNTDQGVQFTAHAFTEELEAARIRISMDGRGRAFDNSFVERLWRTLKYEDVYLKGVCDDSSPGKRPGQLFPVLQLPAPTPEPGLPCTRRRLFRRERARSWGLISTFILPIRGLDLGSALYVS